MGCSCKNKGNSSLKKVRGASLKPTSKSVSNPSKTSNLTPQPKRSVSGDHEEKKRIQKLRREAIKKALGR